MKINLAFYSFSRLLKHISWNYASYSQNYKHKSITSHPIPQTSYFQVKMKLYTQNHSLLLKNQTLPSDRTHKPSKSHTLQHSLRHWCNKFKTTFPKLVSYVACGSPLTNLFTWWTQKTQPMDTLAHFYSFMYYTVQHTHTHTKTKKNIFSLFYCFFYFLIILLL